VNQHKYNTIETWLSDWDDGADVSSVSMSGFGGDYEQALQVIAAEAVRTLIKLDYKQSGFENQKAYDKFIEELDKNQVVLDVAPSGAMFSAAINLAMIMYKRGPDSALSDQAIKDRLIKVSKNAVH